MIQDFSRALNARLIEEIEVQTQALVHGYVQDFAEYKRLTGVVQGLTLAQSHMQALLEQVEHDE